MKPCKRIYCSARRFILNAPSNLKWWFLHRTFCRHNKIEIPSLSPGYYDKDTQLLHGMFDLLVDYVEGELAWMKLILSEERNKIPWHMTLKQYRNKNGRELGLQYLNDEMEFRMELDEDGVCNQGELQLLHEGTQGWSAKEIKEIYLWYKDIRPNRLEMANNEWSWELEEKYNKEDEEMLIRLVKVRLHLWT